MTLISSQNGQMNEPMDELIKQTLNKVRNLGNFQIVSAKITDKNVLEHYISLKHPAQDRENV